MIISCIPVAVPASTNWDLASVESPEALKDRKQKILHEFCKYKPLLYAVRIFQPSAAAPAHNIVRERTLEEKKMSCIQYKASFSRVRIMINILRHLRPDHCARRDHHCPRDLESHLNKRRVPLPPPVIWDDKDEVWCRRLFSTWFVAREWVGVDQMREGFHLYH